jgi:multidrug efflux pump subunit AcrA (membrane-fusion protein)
LTIPNGAIRRDGGKKVVFVMQSNQPVKREVKTGWKDASYTEVLSGLNGGERVVIGEIPGEKK